MLITDKAEQCCQGKPLKTSALQTTFNFDIKYLNIHPYLNVSGKTHLKEIVTEYACELNNHTHGSIFFW